MMVRGVRENSDLLEANPNNGVILQNGNDNSYSPVQRGPPDGGFRAYSVLVGSFLTNGLLFGVINSYSVIYTVLLEQLKKENVTNAETLASLAGVLTMGTTFILSPLSGVLTAFMGLRMTAVLGGTIATAGLFLSSFVVNNVIALCFTYGVLYGLGASLAYTPSLAILGHYFKKYLGRVNGVVTIGSSVFTIFMPPLMELLLKHYGLSGMFRFLSLFTIGIALCGLLFVPIPVITIDKAEKGKMNVKSLLKTITDVHIWKNKKYKFWALSMPIALIGYFVPYVHIKKFIEESQFTDVNVNLPLQCLSFTSGIGRLTFGFLADRPRIDRILLQQTAFYVIGTLTIILPFVRSFLLLVIVSMGMGIFEGGFISLIGPIAFELVGGAYAAQAIGCMLGLAAVPMSIGPPLAGYLFSHFNSYTIPFILAGISPLIGATVMFTVRFQKQSSSENVESNSNGHIIIPAGSPDVDKSPTPLLSNGKANQDNGL